MATIGSFKKSGNEFQGEIITLSVQAKGVRIVPETTRTSDNAPQCMVRPCVAREFRRSGGFAVLHQCIRPLIGAVCAPGPSWISARVRSHYRTGLKRAIWVTRVRMRREDRSSISSHPLADLGGKPIVGLRHLRPPYLFSSFVRATRPFLHPGLRLFGASRAGAVKAGRSSRPPAGLGLDGPEHGAMLKQVGMSSHASLCIRIRAPCGERPRRSVPAYWRARSPARCGAISFWRRRSTP